MSLVTGNLYITNVDAETLMLECRREENCREGKNAWATASLTKTQLGDYEAYSVSASVWDTYLAAEAGVEIEIAAPGEIRGYFADVLYSPYWCAPRFGMDFSDVPKNTQALLWREDEGDFCVIFPVASDVYKCTLASVDGKLRAQMSSYIGWLADCKAPAFLYGRGEDPYTLLHGAAEAAAAFSGKHTKLREKRQYPDALNYLGWCSWDAMEIWVDENGIREKLTELRDKKIPVRWGILDDMWAQVRWSKKLEKGASHGEMFPVMHASSLQNFEADAARFPQGLKHTVEMMKNEFGMMVGIWHPVTGYWAGIDPDSPLAKELDGCLMRHPSGELLPDFSTEEGSYAFFSAFHRFLKDAGADFVKIDNQSCLHRKYAGQVALGQAASNMHAAIEKSVTENFGGQMINCMGMASENMFARENSAVSRASDDFQPENAAWFSKHIMQCSYNSLIQGQYYYCDWDMWWSDDSQAGRNSLLRALSGGPIYVSDKIGRSRPEVFLPLVYSDGRILRCDGQLVPKAECLYEDPTNSGSAFCVFNRSGGAVLCAAFNLDAADASVGGTISPADFPGLDEETDYILYDHFSGCAMPMTYEDEYDFMLKDHSDYRLFLLVPVVEGRAFLGLIDKYASPAAICSVEGNTVHLYEGGNFAFVSGELVKEVKAGGRSLPMERRGILYVVHGEAGDKDLTLL